MTQQQNNPYAESPYKLPAAPAVKLCINCKHYQPGTCVGLDSAEYSTCAKIVRSDNMGLTRIDGRALVIKHKYCDGARHELGECGPDAKLFEAT